MGVTRVMFATCDTDLCSERISIPESASLQPWIWLRKQGWVVDSSGEDVKVYCPRGPVPDAPSLDAPEGYVRVVTRYGGSQHLAKASGNAITATHYAACSGTSAWTLESWAAAPNHPTLRPDEIPKLPPCRRCAQVAPKL